MNERINQLALQARLGPALLLHHWGTVDALTDSEQDGLEQIEKFAELIVKECANLVGGYTKEEEFGPADEKEAYEEIMEYFGVEE